MFNIFRAIIANVESGNKPFAIRFDKRLYEEYSKKEVEKRSRCKVVNDCDDETALMILSTHWGLYQFSGYNLYEGQLWLKVPIGVYLSDIEIQNDVFVGYLEIILGEKMFSIVRIMYDLKYISKLLDDNPTESYAKIINYKLNEIPFLAYFVEKYKNVTPGSNLFVEYIVKMKKYLDYLK